MRRDLLPAQLMANLKNVAVKTAGGLIMLGIVCQPHARGGVASVEPTESVQTRASIADDSSAANKKAYDVMAQGIADFERGAMPAARRNFETALRFNPKLVAAHTYLGVIADAADNLAEAEKHFAQAAELSPASASGRNNYGAILMRRGSYARAAAEFEASLKIDANQPPALVNLAQIRFAENTPTSLRAARDLLERARRLAPDVGIARSLLLIALQLNESEVITSLYRDYYAQAAFELEVVAGADTRHTLTKPPAEIARARTNLGELLATAGFTDEAERELAAALKLDATHTPALTALARLHLKRKDIATAGRMLEAAVANNLDAADVYAALADVYLAANRPDNAIAAMRLAIARQPEAEIYRYRYGMLLTDTQAPAAAVIRLREAIAEFPRSPRLHLALGIALQAAGKTQDAIQAFQQASKLDPKFAPAYAYLASTYTEQGRYAEALNLYAHAIRLEPQLAVTYYLTAETMAKQNDAETAVIEKNLARAIELDARFAQARLALAKLYLRTDRVRAAVAELEQVVNHEPDLVEAYYQLGRAYGRLKQTAQAKSAYATFKRLSDERQQQAETQRRDIVRRLADVRF